MVRLTPYWHEMDWPDLLTVLGEPFGAGPAQDTASPGAARMRTQSPDTAASGDGRVAATLRPPVPPDRPPMWRPGPWELLRHVVRCFTETVRRRP